MKVLIVDDDRSIVEAVTIGLELQWGDMQVVSAGNGESGLDTFFKTSPDLTLLDVNMPRMSGWEMLKRVRELSDAPVIMLTARGEEMDKVKGLELGADDYLTKPFSHLELFARIKAVLRRSEMTTPASAAPSFQTGELAINFSSHEVTLAGQPVKLTPTEYNLLYLLARNAGRVLPFEMLLTKVWGDEYRTETGYLKTYISRIRRKLGDDPDNPHYIMTERGVGYRFVRPISEEKIKD
ncbi:MAG: DNA-binding response regulator [Candidatus Chloroheliales bacterium]|nr:MAG: DNA-binding response regulator [Chloroflexota bacterium]